MLEVHPSRVAGARDPALRCGRPIAPRSARRRTTRIRPARPATPGTGTAKACCFTELGYDLRKPNTTVDPRGSHCGAGAPRFNITTKDGTTYFIGCNSPPPVSGEQRKPGLVRLRRGAGRVRLAYGPLGLTDIAGTEVTELSIGFDEGQDAAPGNFGLAVLDNVDVNGRLVGQGPAPRSPGGDTAAAAATSSRGAEAAGSNAASATFAA